MVFMVGAWDHLAGSGGLSGRCERERLWGKASIGHVMGPGCWLLDWDMGRLLLGWGWDWVSCEL